MPVGLVQSQSGVFDNLGFETVRLECVGWLDICPVEQWLSNGAKSSACPTDSSKGLPIVQHARSQIPFDDFDIGMSPEGEVAENKEKDLVREG